MPEVDVILKNGLIVSGADGPFISGGYVIVSDGTIVEVGEGKPVGYTAQHVIDASDKIVLPGLISAHDHMYGVLAHGIPVKNV